MKKDVMYGIRDKRNGKRVLKLMTRRGTLINEGRKWGYFDRETGKIKPEYELITYELVPMNWCQ